MNRKAIENLLHKTEIGLENEKQMVEVSKKTVINAINDIQMDGKQWTSESSVLSINGYVNELIFHYTRAYELAREREELQETLKEAI